MYASTLVALSLVLSPAPGVCRSAPPAPAEPGRILLPPGPGPRPAPPKPKKARLGNAAVLNIDTGAAGEEGELMQPRIRTMVAEAMKAFNIAEAQGTDLPRVDITVSALGGDQIGWSYTIEVRHTGPDPISGGSVRGECADCLEKELLERVSNDARLTIQQLRVYIDGYNDKVDAENAAAEAPAPAPTPTTPEVSGGSAAAPTGPSPGVDAAPMHPMCKVGAGLMAVGVVGIGAGLALALMPDRQVDPMIGWELRSTRLPGFVTLGVGGAVALAGVALFAAGHRKSRAPRTALVPSFGPGVAGLQWSGRF
ncbi:MAG TPA: hypothetical protein VIK91_00965 [Nannocystis sp.]